MLGCPAYLPRQASKGSWTGGLGLTAPAWMHEDLESPECHLHLHSLPSRQLPGHLQAKQAPKPSKKIKIEATEEEQRRKDAVPVLLASLSSPAQMPPTAPLPFSETWSSCVEVRAWARGSHTFTHPSWPPLTKQPAKPPPSAAFHQESAVTCPECAGRFRRQASSPATSSHRMMLPDRSPVLHGHEFPQKKMTVAASGCKYLFPCRDETTDVSYNSICTVV